MNSETQKFQSSSSTQSEEETTRVPFVISGCSGVGKGTLISALLEKFPHIFEKSVSYTTRQKRVGQQEGVHYHFINTAAFEEEIQKNIFVEYGKIHGDNYYGTSKNQIRRISSTGKICILEINLTAAEKIQKQNPDYNFLFIDPPTFEDLRLRMKARNTQSQQNINIRMTNSIKELQKIETMKFYDRITNEKIQTTLKQLIKYVNRKYKLELQL